MSNLNPGGSRSKGGRIFGAEGIKRACQQAKIADVDKASGSIADREHKGTREQQRRARQQARKEAK
ncbi:MAG: hypothetical protein ACJ75S_06895 [Solirubrobacterales bacterium]